MFILFLFPCFALGHGFDGRTLIPPANYAVQEAPFIADIELTQTETFPIRRRSITEILAAFRETLRVGRDSNKARMKPVHLASRQ
jgi:hypothetical protein